MMLEFFSNHSPSLKVCGVTRADDAVALADLGVHALGVNFWPHSKRHISPSAARDWLHAVQGRILRVGVFVNQGLEFPAHLFENGLIDVVQLHGDESLADALALHNAGIPVIKALNIEASALLPARLPYGFQAALLDTPAPGTYGGTGRTFDWNLAKQFKATHPKLPFLLAGGITPENAAEGIRSVQPCALDVASGAESSPGIKDLHKVRALLDACRCTESV